MRIRPAKRHRLTGASRRDWLVGCGVALALLGTTALELRRSPGPVCGPSCAPGGAELTTGVERWVAAQTNAPATAMPAGRP